MKASEKGLIAIALLAIVGWVLPTFDININATAVAIVAMLATFVCGIINWDDLLKTKAAWNTLIWFGGILGLSSALTKGKFFEWLAKYLEAHMNIHDAYPYFCNLCCCSLLLCIWYCIYFCNVTSILDCRYQRRYRSYITSFHLNWDKLLWWFRNSLRCGSWSNHLLRWLQQCKRLVDSWSYLRRCMFSFELRNRYPLVENRWFHVIRNFHYGVLDFNC